MADKSELRRRSARFLARPFPLPNYAPGNLTDGFIQRYIDGGPWDDPDLPDLLALCYLHTENAVAEHSGDAKSYFEECLSLLREILTETYPGRIEELDRTRRILGW